MSQNIHILPENLCNQIAAGEVVERPASVVKELVENALDAGADRIEVEVEKGGKRLIRVTDNGSGMSREDAFLCLERHATSKVRDAQDLFRLTTLGFRGEALPSIAAVSRLSLRTRVAHAVEGWEIITEGGAVKRASEAGVPPGTCIEVRNLFFNTPARRKFLRRDETELGHVGECLTRLALSSPGVRLRFAHNGRTLWEVNRQRTLRERTAELLGRETVHDMLDLETDGPENMRLHGLISRPGLSRSGFGGMYTFINGRYIRDRVVQHALGEGYRNLLAKGRHPVLVLFLEIDPSQVDVNVHPTKHEVRFRNQAQVHDYIVQALRDRLRDAAPDALQVAECTPFPLPHHDRKPVRSLPARPEEEAAPTEAPLVAPSAASVPDRATPVDTAPRVEEAPTPYPASRHVRQAEPATPAAEKMPLFSEPPSPSASDEGQGGNPGFFSGLQILGQYQNSYLVCQSGQELILVDQHAAHERIGFEQLKRQYLSGFVEGQLLLFPLVLEFDFRQARVLGEHEEALSRLGFAIEPFGGNAFALKALPRMLGEADAETLVRDVVEELASVGRSQRVEIELESILIKMACHGMVRAHQRLVEKEMRALLEELDATPFNTHCPHGRPTFVRWTLGEVERLFKRS